MTIPAPLGWKFSLECGAQMHDRDKTCSHRCHKRELWVPRSLSVAHGHPCWGMRWRKFQRSIGNPLLRGRLELLLEETGSWSGTSARKRPELEARCFGVGDGRRGLLGPWSVSPALGTWLSQKPEEFFPFQAPAAAQNLWAFLEKLSCPPDIPARTPVTPVSRDSVGM